MNRCMTYDVLAGGIASASCFVAGIVMGYPSASIAPLQSEGLLTLSTVPWFASAAMLGALCGCQITGHISDFLGRKGNLLLMSIPAMLGWFLICSSQTVVTLLIGRFLSGLASAMNQGVSVYIVEITDKSRRGTVTSLLAVFFNLGILVSYILGLLLNWRWVAVCTLAFVVVGLLLVLPLPETPRWHILHHQRNEATRSILWLQPNATAEEVEKTITQIRDAESHGNKKLGLLSLFRKQFIKQIFIGMLVMGMNQLCGKYTTSTYQNKIFMDAGFQNPDIASIVVAAFCVVGGICGAFAMDKLGRKPLYLFGGVVLTISCLTLGICFYLKQPQNKVIQMISLVSLIVYNFVFAMTWSGLSIVIVAEIFPLEYRGVGAGFGTMFFWFFGFVILTVFPPLETLIGDYGLFFMFSIFSVIGTITAGVVLIETKGRSLEDIQKRFISSDHKNNYSTFP